MSEIEEEKIGYGKPPKKHRFKPGQSGNPKGRPKVYKSPISVLEEPIAMRVDGKTREVSSFEAAFRKTAQKALEGRLSAIKRFFKECEKAKLLTNENVQPMSGVWYAELDPANFPWHEFNEAELAEIDRLNTIREKDLFGRKKPISEHETVISRVALERHSVPGQRHKLNVLQLVQVRLKQRAFKDSDESSLAFFMELAKQTTIDTVSQNVGVLVVPPRTPPWLSQIRIEDVETGREVKLIGPGHADYDPSQPFRAQTERGGK
ncbi:MAG: DUF5681 domain-containing protein [Pseudomonadota bacterium]